MAWLNAWWQDEVVDGYKGPLLLSFVAFVVTFVATRTITRLIRAGKGPFHNVSSGGVHMHHSTPGVVLLILGGFTAVGSPPLSVWTYIAGVLVGIGASLVLDEFAMIFRLQDVYWSQEGQLSVNIVTLAAACIGLAAVGVSPVKLDELPGNVAAVRIGATVRTNSRTPNGAPPRSMIGGPLFGGTGTTSSAAHQRRPVNRPVRRDRAATEVS